jgi:hypothetical protein
MASEPQLANLSSEPPDKYQHYFSDNELNPSVQCGMILLDAIFGEGASALSETMVFALYQYAHLVQRIFFLSKPTTSKSTQTWLPNTFAEFKTDFQSNPATALKYYTRLKEFTGYGGTGFPSNVASHHRYGLWLFFDTQTNMIISGNLFISKIVPVTPQPQPTVRFVNEIWGVAADPLYMKSGAGASLLLGGLYYAGNILYDLYNSDATIQSINDDILFANLTVELEVAKDLFPFIDFMERFTFYARNGFSYASGEINTIYPNNTYVNNTPLNLVEFNSKYLKDNTSSIAFVRNLNNETVTLDAWKALYIVSVPNPDPASPIWFKTKTMNQYDENKLFEDFEIVFKKIKRSEASAPAPTQIGFITHSRYIVNNKLISTFKVPPKLEIIIINSPGYSTRMSSVSKSWNMNVKYLRNVSMDYLKKLFPSFKTTVRNGEQVIPLHTQHTFTYATSGGILFDVMHANNIREYLQIHCYDAGDFCPDMILGADLGGTTTDFAAAFFGAYNISNPTDYRLLQMTNNISKLDSLENHLFNGSDQNKLWLSNNGYTWPDSQFRFSPKKEELVNYGIRPDNKMLFHTTLKSFIDRMDTSNYTKIRLCLFSCGVTDDVHDNAIQQYFSGRNNHKISVSTAEYEKRINKLGEAIFDIYNMNISQYGLSPASAAIQSIADDVHIMNAFSFQTNLKGSRGSRKVSKGSRGSRKVSKGSRGSRKLSKGSRGSRKVSKGSRGSRKLSKGSRGSHKVSKGSKASTTNSLSNL